MRKIVAFALPAAEAAAPGLAEQVYLDALLTLQEAADEATTSLKTLQRARVNQWLDAVRFGERGWRVRRRQLRAWIDLGAPTKKARR